MTGIPRTSRPAAAALALAGIASLEEFSKHTEREVLALHGMGPKALGIIKAAMGETGIAFRAEGSRRQGRAPAGT
jgi:hypothetical protein